MKRTTIITISAIVFGFVFWSTLPGLLSSVKTKTLSIDDTETIKFEGLDKSDLSHETGSRG